MPLDSTVMSADVPALASEKKSLDHTRHSAEKSEHRGSCRRGGEPWESLPEIGHFDVARVLDGHKHIVHRTAYARESLVDQTRVGVSVLRQRLWALSMSPHGCTRGCGS